MIVLLEFYKTHHSEYLPVFRGMVNFFSEAGQIYLPLSNKEPYWWETVQENHYLPAGIREKMNSFLGRQFKSCRVLRTVPPDESQPVLESCSQIYMVVEF